MAKEKQDFSSDTLERSNLSSLQSDLSSINKTTELNSTSDHLKKFQSCYCQQHMLENLKFLPCPLLNSNFNPTQYSSKCICERVNLNESNLLKQKSNGNVRNEWQRFNWKWPRQSYTNKKDKKSYDVRSKMKRHLNAEKPFMCCNISQGIPKSNNSLFRSITENPIKLGSTLKNNNNITEKIEIYYFDHGNSAYYHTTDIPPILTTEGFAEKSNSVATKCWAEVFGWVHIAASFVTVFLLQFIRCILITFVRPLVVGVIQLIADYFIKPLLSIIFNGIIQPFLILLYNITTSVKDCCEPLAAALGFYMKEIALLFRSCRLIEITHKCNHTANT